MKAEKNNNEIFVIVFPFQINTNGELNPCLFSGNWFSFSKRLAPLGHTLRSANWGFVSFLKK